MFISDRVARVRDPNASVRRSGYALVSIRRPFDEGSLTIRFR
jgi:hypothetical protein